jgi:predicted RND superfamily exporter protein
MVTERIFVTNAVQGLVLSIAFASVVLLFATHNILVTLYSVLMITCVISSVLGVMQLIGWNLGVAESLATDFFVGFSVDYIVHIAHQYVDAPHTDRRGRIRSAYANIGVALFSGAATTFIAVTFLLFT